jgi:MarR family transcriptional regulator, organic hydroperoxide resistance regulator
VRRRWRGGVAEDLGHPVRWPVHPSGALITLQVTQRQGAQFHHSRTPSTANIYSDTRISEPRIYRRTEYPRSMHAQPATATGAIAQPADLTWLLHRAAQRMRAALDQVARTQRLAGVRDWIVLSALIVEPGRTQLALGHALGLDKTTLTSLLDRLETDGLIIRQLDPRDRRARIPQITTAGRRTQANVTRARDHAEAELLKAFSADEQRLLRDLLTRLAADQHGACLPSVGSCI